jgi:hypothetical protein
MTGALTDLLVAARLGLHVMSRRLRGKGEPALDLDAFERDMERAFSSLPAGVVAERVWVRMPATEPPWRDTGVALQAGEEVSLFAAGRTYVSRPLDVWVTPKTQLWARLGERGTIRSSSRDTNTLRADTPGNLYLGNYFPNDWKDATGARIHGDAVYQQVTGEMRVLVVRWCESAQAGLDALVAVGDPCGLASSERERLSLGEVAPAGWHYLWHLGEAEIFRPCEDPSGAPALCCDVQGDVAILQRDAPFPLRPGTELSWRWCVDSLPGLFREDSAASHDYLSIAVEFGNGLDLTYYWSRALPVGTSYWCPLPNWKHREHHVVIRSGAQGLGVWQGERRDLHADALRYLGSHPGDVVRVWLIAVSLFNREPGACSYADIRLRNGGEELSVL